MQHHKLKHLKIKLNILNSSHIIYTNKIKILLTDHPEVFFFQYDLDQLMFSLNTHITQYLYAGVSGVVVVILGVLYMYRHRAGLMLLIYLPGNYRSLQ